MPKMFRSMEDRTRLKERDSQREKLYRAERAVRDEHGGKQFESVEEMQAYIDNLLRQEWFNRTWPHVIHRVTVHSGAGNRRATCSHCWGGYNRCPEIKMPRWARCEQILLHELAHALTPVGAAAHGWEFAQAMLRLVKNRIGKEAEKALRLSFRKHRVRMKPKRSRPMSEEQKAALRERLAGYREQRVAAVRQLEEENV